MQIATYIPTVPKELFNYYYSFGNIPLTTNYQTFFNYYKGSSCNGVAVLSDHFVNNNFFPIFNFRRQYGKVIFGNSDANAFIKVLDFMLEIWSTNAMNLQCGIKKLQLSVSEGLSLENITDGYGKSIHLPFGLRITYDSNVLLFSNKDSELNPLPKNLIIIPYGTDLSKLETHVTNITTLQSTVSSLQNTNVTLPISVTQVNFTRIGQLY
jgi:hypothetical protein